MRRTFCIYRGTTLIGYVGRDDKPPCEPFEPTEAFAEVAELFEKEFQLESDAAELDRLGKLDESTDRYAEADEVLADIMRPGIRFENPDGSPAFDCSSLSIGDGRVCWR